MLPLPVFDMHAHLPYTGEDLWGEWGQQFSSSYGRQKLELWNQRNAKAQVDWWQTYGFGQPQSPQPSPEECAALFAAEVERYGLLGLVFLTGGGNRELARLLAPHPKLLGFAFESDPFRRGAARDLWQGVTELGLKGYKLFGPAILRPLDDVALNPVWEACEELQIPVLIHFGPLGGGSGLGDGVNINPLRLHEVAKRFPTVPFVVPHFGCGFPNELMRLMWACDNVYVDTSGNNEWRRYMWPEPTLKDLFQKFYELFGPQRILFGTDASWFPRGWVHAYFAEQYRAVVELGIPRAHQELIFAGNALRLLGLKELG